MEVIVLFSSCSKVFKYTRCNWVLIIAGITIANMNNCMTPVSVLQELCAKKGVTPQYDTIGQEGDSHQPIFTIRCIAGGSMGSGQGHSKKDAKQAAAKDLLEQLGVDTSAFESQQSNSVDEVTNPVGQLQELVTRLGLRRPQYEADVETGSANDRRFIISVTVGDYTKQGCEKNKRLAKRKAAEEMLEYIQSLSESDPGLGRVETVTDSKPKKKSRHSQKSSALSNLPKANGPHVTRLRSCYDYASVHEMLQGVAEELQFQVVYTLLNEKNTDDMFQCLIHMSTSPESVCFAVGATEDEAKTTAATNAIKYLLK
ncbi:putative RISC-loading complex subunit [Apostichopus japonicus]|uniref:Putative RISC-loading complex subunit n=1 Tax=Stichopus japonicus TaxID=307972 RepID=A0A2G8LQ95_STIJA|nr:putative RISC-loading complex subunit [Apostichopus japonicus]